MKFIRHAFDKLKELNYFEDNVNIMLISGNKEHRREFEKFICCDGNYKRFLKNFLELKDKIKKDKSLAREILNMYKDLLYNSNETNMKLECMYYIAPMVTYLFMNSLGKLKIGNLVIDNNFTRCIEILFNEKYSMLETVNRMRKAIGVSETPKPTVKGVHMVNMIDIDLFYLQTYMYLYSFYLIQTKLYTSHETMRTFENGIRNVHNSFIKTNSDVMELYQLMRDSRMNTQQFCREYGYESMPTPLQLLHCRRYYIEEMYELEEFKKLNRLGYLKQEFCTGTMLIEDDDKPYKFTFDYDIREVVNVDGIEIVYTMYSDDFVVTVVEDYTRGQIFANIIFYDFSTAHNTDETITMSLVVFYMRLRDKYVEMVNTKDMVTKEITFDDVWNTEHKQRNDEDYIRKPIFIAPYRRKLPKGKVSEEKKQEALKFNIILGDNETFVNSFIRKQRYLKENGEDLPDNVEDLRVGIGLEIVKDGINKDN